MNIKEISAEINYNAHDKGFWEENYNISEKLMLIVSEIAEAQEADRKDSYCKVYSPEEKDTILKYIKGNTIPSGVNYIKGTFEEELADIVIRVFDLAYERGIDLEWFIQAKHEYNKTRPHKHGKKY